MERNDNDNWNSNRRRRASVPWGSKNCCDDHRHGDHRLWMAVGIIFLGLLILGNNLHFLSFEIRKYIFTWEVFLIFLGLVFIFGRGNRSTGIILLVIGSAFYMKNVLNMIDFNFWQVFWPAMLILAGFMIIFRHYFDRDPRKNSVLSGENIIDEVAVFGGGDRVVTSQEFQGGKVTTIFGGLNYNMLNAKLATGDNYIDVFCLFGGMKLIVPEGWVVKIRVMSIFGGFNDKQRYRAPDTKNDNTAQLIIKGTAIFGGGEIKRYLD